MYICRDNRCHICGDPWAGGQQPSDIADDPYTPYEYLAHYDDYDSFWPLLSREENSPVRPT
jgi:hypothetical protein